jgi:hypothetical protein
MVRATWLTPPRRYAPLELLQINIEMCNRLLPLLKLGSIVATVYLTVYVVVPVDE